VGLSETHWAGAGDWMQEGVQFISSGGEDEPRRGIGFVINANVQKALIG